MRLAASTLVTVRRSPCPDVVVAQQVATECARRAKVPTKVAGEIPPDRVDVIAAVLRGVVLDQDQRALHAIVVRRAARRRARPCEAERVDPAGACAREARFGKPRLEARRVDFDDLPE